MIYLPESNHLPTFIRSMFIESNNFLISLLARYSAVSSAKRLKCSILLHFVKSFMNNLNRRGDKHEPWGDPTLTDAKSDSIEPTLTFCFLFARKLVNSLISLPRTPFIIPSTFLPESLCQLNRKLSPSPERLQLQTDLRSDHRRPFPLILQLQRQWKRPWWSPIGVQI